MTPIKSPAPVAVDAPAPSTKPPIPPQVTKKTRPRTLPLCRTLLQKFDPNTNK